MKAWFVAALLALASGCATVPAEYRGAGVAAHVPPAPLSKPRPVVALALGSGGKRSIAHIGVQRVLEKAGIHPDLVVGTSGGAIVGALYAAGLRGAELERAAEEMDPRMTGEPVIAGWRIFAKGLFSGERIQTFVNRHVGNRPIEALPLPFAAVATDAHTGEIVIFNRGDTGMAVRASASVPVIFDPVRIEGRDYVDGGLVAPLPVEVARHMGADIVIAVNVAFTPEEMPLRDPVDMAWQTVQIMSNTIYLAQRAGADVLIEPDLKGLSDRRAFDRARVIERGEHAARAALPAILAKLAARAR